MEGYFFCLSFNWKGSASDIAREKLMGKKKFGNQKETKRKECEISSDREGKKSSHPPKTQNQIMHTAKLENITKLFFLVLFCCWLLQ